MIQYRNHDLPVPSVVVSATSLWIAGIINRYGKKVGNIFFIFCSDAALLEINKLYLNHDYYTDIITFNNSANEDIVSGECYLSVERIRENAELLDLSFEQELHRVMIHGVLHLIGFNDGNEDEKLRMRELEKICLLLRK